MWNVGNVEIKNKVVLAPMAGISNPAYMKICEDMGVGYCLTELISAEAIVRGNKKTFDMFKGYDKLSIPVACQLFGSNAEVLSRAAKIVEDMNIFRAIDLNFGCPVPKVAVHSEAGSALLKNPDKIKEIVSSVVSSVNVPVTVKIRSGWDFDSINAVEVAKICEEAGASSISIHARTRSQGYSGKADWNIIKLVKENVTIPVIGNGDIRSCFDAKRMLDETLCDAVMIGRAALGNPWLIKQTVSFLEDGTIVDNPTTLDKIDMCIKHLNLLLDIKCEKVAALEIRNQIGWYLKGIKDSNEIKNKVYQTRKINDIITILNEFRKKESGEKNESKIF